MNVNLSPQLERFVQKNVESGRYDSASQVVCEALKLLAQRHRVRAGQLCELQDHIDEGLASLARGEGADGERFMAKLIAELDAKPLRRKGK